VDAAAASLVISWRMIAICRRSEIGIAACTRLGGGATSVVCRCDRLLSAAAVPVRRVSAAHACGTSPSANAATAVKSSNLHTG